MIWVGGNIVTDELDGATVHADSGRISQDEFEGASNKNPNLVMLSLSWIYTIRNNDWDINFKRVLWYWSIGVEV